MSTYALSAAASSWYGNFLQLFILKEMSDILKGAICFRRPGELSHAIEHFRYTNRRHVLYHTLEESAGSLVSDIKRRLKADFKCVEINVSICTRLEGDER